MNKLINALLFLSSAACLLIISYKIDKIDSRVKNVEATTQLLNDIPVSEYQLTSDEDSIYVWDGTRPVGSTAWAQPEIDKIILWDNQGDHYIKTK